MQKKCIVCNSTYIVKNPANYKKSKYCSDNCRYKNFYYSEKGKLKLKKQLDRIRKYKSPLFKSCLTCQKKYEVRPCNYSKSKYCSKKCNTTSEKYKSRIKDYYLKNKSSIKEYQKKYKSKNKERLYIQTRLWKKNNPDKNKLHSLKYSHNRRVLQKKGLISLDSKYVDKIMKETLNCKYCKCKLSKNNKTLEHLIPISKKGTNEKMNLLIICKSCNFSRANKDLITWADSKNISLDTFILKRYINMKSSLIKDFSK